MNSPHWGAAVVARGRTDCQAAAAPVIQDHRCPNACARFQQEEVAIAH